MRLFFILSLLTLFSFTLSAQLLDEAVMDVGRLRLHISPDGSWGSDEQAFLEWRKDDGEYVSLLQKGGLHIGAQNPDDSLNVSVLDGTDNVTGGIGENLELVGVFKATKAQVLAHRADFADNFMIDDPIDAIYSWPGLGNQFLEEYTGIPSSFNSSGAADFWDNQGTGFYEPQFGSTPYLYVRTMGELCSPERVPNQMYWLTFRNVADGTSLTEGIELRMTIASYDCEDAPDTELNNRTIIIHTLLINWEEDDQTDTRFGYRFEAALGDPTDDALGTDPELGLAYFYPNDEQDAQFGDEKVPAVGIRTIRTPFDENVEYTEIANVLPVYDFPNGPSALGQASTPAEAYNLIRGQWIDGSPLSFGGLGYQTGGEPTDWAFPGTPGDNESWTYADLDEVPDRIGFVASTEPILLQYGTFQEMTQVITVTDAGNNAFERVASLKQDFVEIGDLPIDELICDLLPACSELPSANTESLVLDLAVILYPNPVNDQLAIQLPADVREASASITDAAGKLWLQSSKVNNEQFLITTDQLPSGLYFVTVRTEQGQRTLRFVRD